MADNIIENQTFEGTDFTRNQLPEGVYEDCEFLSCDFSECNLSERVFIGCVFEQCNLGLASLKNTTLQEAVFRNCKMTGTHFEQCNQMLLSFRFERCLLQLSSFHGLKIPSTLFNECNMQEVDFTGADLTGSVFRKSDLYHAIFDNTILEKTDLRTAENFIIDPETNYIHNARVSPEGLPGLLSKYELKIE